MAMRNGVESLKRLLLFIETATPSQLLTLNKLGPKKRDQILSLREKGTVTLKDLMSVRGVSSNSIALWSGDNNVKKIIDSYCYIIKIYGDKCPNSNSVTSIDLGTKVITFTSLLRKDRVHLKEWQQFQVLFQPYELRSSYNQISELFSLLPRTDAYLLERQSHRTLKFAHSGFLQASLLLRIEEAILYTIGKERDMNMFTISPSKVGQYFELETHSRKKRSAVAMVKRLIGDKNKERIVTPFGNTLAVTPEFREFYVNERKLDDYSDSILQGIAFLEWMELSHLLK